jgi:L-fucose mutarotase/ribose pyranase (RbsD/FucU family)
MTDLKSPAASEWELRLRAILPFFGHRNWIVVADAAYPAQSKPGIETILAGEKAIRVVQKVMDAIKVCGHICAKIYTDSELSFVAEQDAPGVTKYRRRLNAALAGSMITQIPHEQIIARLDQAAQVFRILVIKTELTIPYTSVFFELDCGYWNAEAEARLRQAIASADARAGAPALMEATHEK